MCKLIYLMMFLASLDPTYQEASDQGRRALLETDAMKAELKELEYRADQQLFHYTGLRKDDLVYAAYGYPVFAGKISSKPFKGFKYETKDHFTIRPEIEYGLWDRNISIYVGFVKEF